MSKIHQIPLAEIVRDLKYAGRTEAEINKNAKDLPEVKANGWDEAQPGQVFKGADGKWHLAAGYTRYAAAVSGNHKDGFFIEIENDPKRLRTVAIRTNSGKSISSLAKGHIYVAMRDGSDPANLSVGEEAMEPMEIADIAQEAGVSRQAVEFCIALAESPEEVRVMLEANQIATQVASLARKAAKGDESKMIKALRLAIKKAKEDGKETATRQHFDAIKAEVFPLKAAKNTPPPPSEPAQAPIEPQQEKQDAPEQPESKDDVDPWDGGEQPNQDGEPEDEKPASKPAQSALDLGAPAPQKTKVDPKAKRDETIAALTVLITKFQEDCTEPMCAEEMAMELAKFLADSGVSVPVSPV